MSAVIDHVTGKGRSLDRIPETPTPLAERDVEDRSTVVRLLSGLLRDVARLAGRWTPRHVDFVGVVLDATGTALLPLHHGFGGVVRFWIVDWDGAAAHNVRKHTSTTNHVLVLTSTSAGTATVRIEEAG